MRELKKAYREGYEGLKQVKGEVFFIQQSIDQLKQVLVAEFEEWYQATFDEEDLGGTAESHVNLEYLIYL